MVFQYSCGLSCCLKLFAAELRDAGRKRRVFRRGISEMSPSPRIKKALQNFYSAFHNKAACLQQEASGFFLSLHYRARGGLKRWLLFRQSRTLYRIRLERAIGKVFILLPAPLRLRNRFIKQHLSAFGVCIL